MLRYNMDLSGEPLIEQVRRRPRVYLDHWAIREFSSKSDLGNRLTSTLERSNGDLALSVLSFAEFAGLTDLAQAAAAERLVEGLLPHLFFIRFEPWEVLQREETFDAGRSIQAPEGDEQVLEMVAHLPGAGLSGWTIKGIFTEPSVRRDRLISTIESFEKSGVEGVRRLRDRLDKEKDLRRAKRRRLKDLAATRRATRPLLWELITELEANRAGEPTGNDMIDLMHTVVPCAYCDFVVIDRRWQLAVDRARERMVEADIDAPVARVFSKPNDGLERFLNELEMFTPSKITQ